MSQAYPHIILFCLFIQSSIFRSLSYSAMGTFSCIVHIHFHSASLYSQFTIQQIYIFIHRIFLYELSNVMHINATKYNRIINFDKSKDGKKVWPTHIEKEKEKHSHIRTMKPKGIVFRASLQIERI